MDRDVTQLEREFARRPEDRGLALRLAQALARAGARARALALAEGLLFAAPEPGASALRSQLLESPAWEGAPELEWLDRPGEEVLALALDIAERRLAIGRARGAPIEVTDLATGDAAELAGHRRSTTALAFPPLADRLVTGGGDGVVRLVDLASRKRIARLKGTGSRCLLVRALPGPDGPLLEGRWRGERYLQPGEAPIECPFPFVVTPGLDRAARQALDTRIRRRVGELFPEHDPVGGLFPWFRNTFRPPLVEDHRFLVVGSTCGKFWALLIEGGVELHRVAAASEEDPVRVVRDRRVTLPRGVPENQPPAASLGPGGAALLLGGAGVASDTSDRVAQLVALDGRGEIRAYDCGQRVTAVTLSAGGGMAAIGTSGGQVGILRLLPQREADRPVLRAATTPAAPAVAADEALHETGAPSEDPEAFALLRRFAATRFRAPPRACHLDADRLWVYQGRAPTQYIRGLPPSDRPVYREIEHLDLATGHWGLFPYLLHGDGSCHAYRIETRWLVLSGLRATPAPADVRCPPLPGKASGRLPHKKAVREQLDLELRDRWPSPRGPLVAIRAKSRPQELWLVHGGDPARSLHLELPAPMRHLSWSPGGTRLALTLDDHQVWLYGTLS